MKKLLINIILVMLIFLFLFEILIYIDLLLIEKYEIQETKIHLEIHNKNINDYHLLQYEEKIDAYKKINVTAIVLTILSIILLCIYKIKFVKRL